jgi:hypothetical protein
MPQAGPSILFKFGDLEHLQSLQRGWIYMNPWRYFRDCEKSVERDANEGAHAWINPQHTSIEIADHSFRAEGGTIKASISVDDHVTKIFCASAFCKSIGRQAGQIFDDRVKSHGESLLVIWNVGGFFGKLGSALKRLNSEGEISFYEAQFVEYFDEMIYDGDVGPFRKSSRYSHEKEWRLMVQNVIQNDEPLVFDFDSIADDSEIIPTAAFKNRIGLNADGSIQINI